MMSFALYNISRRVLCNNARAMCILRDTSKYSVQRYIRPTCLNSQPELRSNLTQLKRFKSKKKSEKHRQEDEDSDAETDEDAEELELDQSLQKVAKVVESKVNSLRLDNVAKAGLGISRNKVDTAFYESNIRINGEVVLKKSGQIHVGDEIDLIVGKSIQNPDFLLVTRATVLSIKPISEGFRLKFSREKNLLIEDYDEPWKGN